MSTSSDVIPEPNLIDRVVTWFSPVHGLERVKARAMLSAVGGGWRGARRDRGGTSEWRPGANSADADNLPDLVDLRGRSRSLIRDAPMATGAIRTVKRDVIGPELTPQSDIDPDRIGISKTEADDLKGTIKEEWSLFAGSTDCDATRVDDMAGIQKTVLDAALASGDVFAIRRFRTGGSPFGLNIQLLEADQVSNPVGRMDRSVLQNGNTIAGGVEITKEGVHIAYHVQKEHPGELRRRKREWSRLERFSRGTKRARVLHVFERTRPGQTRGIPYLAPIIEPMKVSDRYTEAELVAAATAAMFTAFVETQLGGLTESAAIGEKSEAGSGKYRLGAGAIVELRPGQKVNTANPGRPNSGFDAFQTAVERRMAVALGLNYETFVKRYQSSYSASRAALLDAWKFFLTVRDWYVRKFLNPVYGWFLEELVAKEIISAPGFFEDPRIRAAYCAVNWFGPSPTMIDPLKEIQAAKGRVELGATTLPEETATLTGGDFYAKLRERVRVNEALTKAGIPTPDQVQTPSVARKTVEELLAEPDDTSDDETPRDQEQDGPGAA